MIPRRLATSLCLAVLALSACKKDGGGPASATSAQGAAAAKPHGNPSDLVYAASAHLRVVDAKLGKVTAGVDLQRAITAITFTPTGDTAFLAASDGVYAVDTKDTKLEGRLTEHPARQVALDETGTKLRVLEHQVLVQPDGIRDIQPFHLVTLDLATRAVVSDEEIGQRILFAVPSGEGRHGLLVTEAGTVELSPPNKPLADATPIELEKIAGAGPMRVRGIVEVHAGHAYVAVEAERSLVLDVDLASGRARPIGLERQLLLRGIAVTADGKQLLVNAVKELVLLDLATGAIRASLELDGAHTGLALSGDGKWAFLAKTIDEKGGAVTAVRLEDFTVSSKIHLDDISPWAIAVKPRVEVALR